VSSRALGSAPLLIVASVLLFATMGVCVKLVSPQHHVGELVLARGVVGALVLWWWARKRGIALRTPVPAMHAWRCTVGVLSLALWFYSLRGLPLATGMTLNYMSSVWMAVFMIGGAVSMGSARIDSRLMATVLVGFAGVALVLRPTLGQDQLGAGLAGLLSGMTAAIAYLQVTVLARAGEPEERVVFYFSIGNLVAGAAMVAWLGVSMPTWSSALLLLAIGVLAAGGQLLMTRAYGIGRPLVNASLQYMGIVFATAYGVLLFDEALTWTTALGIVLIVGAGLVATRLRAQTTQTRDASKPE
jgi:drug/metabolite transporter (DMT)-like permease